MKIIAITTQKGGVGKTTTTAALSQAAAAAGKRVLAVDFDPQGNMSFILSASKEKKGAYSLLNGEPIKNTIQETAQGVDVIAASRDLATLKNAKGSAYILQDGLEEIKKKYDLVFIDTPPGISLLQYNALQACNTVIVPMLTDTFSLQAVFDVIYTVEQFKKTNTAFKRIGAIITMYDGRSVLARDIEKTIKEQLKANNVLYMGKVRRAVALQEAFTLQESLYNYAPNCKPAEDYKKVLNIVEREM